MINRKNGLRALALAAAFLLALTTGPWSARADSRKELRLNAEALETLQSVKTQGEGFHSLDYKGDYLLKELLATGAENQKALNAFISEKLLEGLPFYHDTLRMGCSTFTAATPEGERIMGRNMDLGGAQAFILRTRPAQGYESLSMVSGLPLGYIERLPDSLIGRLFLLAMPYYPTDGINEKGLSVAVLLLQDTPVRQDTGKTPITTMLALRLMLDKAATVDEAVALLKAHDMRSIFNASYHFHIADAQGKSVVIEYVDNEMRVNSPKGHGHVATNFYLSPDKADLLDDGKDRTATLQAALDETKGVVAPEKAWRMLKSVEAVHDYDKLTGIDFNTAYSIVYNNTRRTMDVCINANFDVVYSFKVGKDF